MSFPFLGAQLIFAHANTRRAREMQDDLGFDARFRQVFESKRLADGRQLMDRAVMQFQTGPEIPWPPHTARFVKPGSPHFAQHGDDLVRVHQPETRIA
jgi:hypothetical protein